MTTTFGERVKQTRAHLKLSRREVGARAGLTEAKVWSIENGRRTTPAEEEALTHVLGLGEAPSIQGVHATQVILDETDFGTWVDGPSPAVGETVTLVEPVAAPPEPPPAPDLPPLVVPSIGGGPVPQEGVRLVSNSEIQTFLGCRRKWWLGWHRGLRPKTESAVGPRAIGDRVHRALRFYYVPAPFERIDPRTALERLIIEDWTALSADGQPSQELKRRFDQEANLERVMIAGYLEWLTTTGEDADLEVIAPEAYVEAGFSSRANEQEITGYEEVRLIGRLDVRARRRTDGSIVFVDHKTVASITARTRLLPLDPQMLHYHLLEWLTTKEGETRAGGAVYNMLRRVKRTPGAKPPFYARVHVPHNDHELQSYALQVAGIVTEMLRVEDLLGGGEVDPRATAYARRSGDCTWCPFFQVCGMFDDGSRAEDMLKTYYDVGDPLSYYADTAPATTEEVGD